LKSKRNPLKLSLVGSPAGNIGFDLGAELKLKFNNPLTQVAGDSVVLKEDTTKIKGISAIAFRNELNIISWDSTNMVEDPNFPDVLISAPISINFKGWKENTNYHLFIPPGSLTDLFGLKNDTIKVDFKTRELKYYGSLKLTIEAPAMGDKKRTLYQGKDEELIEESFLGKYIVQLLDDRENIIRENTISNTEILNYTYLHPNKYHLKVILDENGNGKWDTGNYLKKIQPEKVIYNAEQITIRSNWDAEIDWKINE
jgi:hypothetical protein